MAPPRVFTLRHDGLAAEIAPALGAAVLSLRFHGRHILRPGAAAAVAADPRNAACFPCVPWFGRLFSGIMADDGARRDLAPTLPACDPTRPLHGEGWTREWAVIAHTDVFLECLTSSDGAQAGRFPFAYEARQIAQIMDGALRIDLLLKNIDTGAMPAGLGLHPYFPRTPETRISFAAKEFWTPGAKGGGARGALPEDADFTHGAPLPARTLDHSYTDFAGAVTIDQPGAAARLNSGAPALHVFAPEGEDFFCLEPVTHLPGAFGGDRLQPGETLRLSMTIGPAGD